MAESAPQAPDIPLKGKVALVTGASDGMGSVVCAALERDGAQIVGLDRRAPGPDSGPSIR